MLAKWLLLCLGAVVVLTLNTYSVFSVWVILTVVLLSFNGLLELRSALSFQEHKAAYITSHFLLSLYQFCEVG